MKWWNKKNVGVWTMLAVVWAKHLNLLIKNEYFGVYSKMYKLPYCCYYGTVINESGSFLFSTYFYRLDRHVALNNFFSPADRIYLKAIRLDSILMVMTLVGSRCLSMSWAHISLLFCFEYRTQIRTNGTLKN